MPVREAALPADEQPLLGEQDASESVEPPAAAAAYQELAWRAPPNAGFPPLFELTQAVIDPKGKITLTRLQASCGAWEETVQVQEEGRPIQFAVTRSAAQIMRTSVDPRAVQAFGVDGKELDRRTLAERLMHETTVLAAADKALLDPNHLKLLKDDVLILVTPAAGHGGHAAMPAPVVMPVPEPAPPPIAPAAPCQGLPRIEKPPAAPLPVPVAPVRQIPQPRRKPMRLGRMLFVHRHDWSSFPE